jgi:hypothetical protein
VQKHKIFGTLADADELCRTYADQLRVHGFLDMADLHVQVASSYGAHALGTCAGHMRWAHALGTCAGHIAHALCTCAVRACAILRCSSRG